MFYSSVVTCKNCNHYCCFHMFMLHEFMLQFSQGYLENVTADFFLDSVLAYLGVENAIRDRVGLWLFHVNIGAT